MDEAKAQFRRREEADINPFPRRKPLSPAARKKLSRLMKARWAERRKTA